MTVGGDHPDWQAYANWRGPTFATSFQFPLSSSNPYNIADYVTNYQALIVNVAGEPAGGLQVLIEFYTDATQTIFMGEHLWEVPSACALFAIVPVLGNYCVVNVTTPTTGTTDTTIVIVPSNTPAPSVRYNVEQNYVTGWNQSIAAGTTKFVPFPYISEGPSSFMFTDNGGSGKFDTYLAFQTQAGAEGNPFILYGANNQINFEFIAPRAAIGIAMTNTDTVAHSASWYLCIDGR
jgi:hypothetical protein